MEYQESMATLVDTSLLLALEEELADVVQLFLSFLIVMVIMAFQLLAFMVY